MNILQAFAESANTAIGHHQASNRRIGETKFYHDPDNNYDDYNDDWYDNNYGDDDKEGDDDADADADADADDYEADLFSLKNSVWSRRCHVCRF